MPGPETKRVTVGQLLDELLADYELHGRRSIKGVRSHVKRVREELGEIRALDLKAKDLTGYQIARRRADAAGGTINRELALYRRAPRQDPSMSGVNQSLSTFYRHSGTQTGPNGATRSRLTLRSLYW
jgi:hypothetical protein